MNYQKFDKINGKHPWRKVSPDGYIDYQVFYREKGKIIYFNYDLAKEMGLLTKSHPSEMNDNLKQKLLETFSLQVYNEYNIWKKTPKDNLKIKKNPYMATRYLQLQHKSRHGKTSGDGRSIWNGCVTNKKGTTYDVSSRGTGATLLSPGAQEAKDFIQTGNDTYGYASGMADLDEMLSGAILSEIFFRRNIPTERTLLVIYYPDNTSIGVRTFLNLIRPAHIFRYLKMNRLNELKASFDYFLGRQVQNNLIPKIENRKEQYQEGLRYIAKNYGKLAAILEDEYIFSWLAWDGDNLLASGEILDYGSIRQFASKHSGYRYEDADRFSTSLSEQRGEAKQLVQVFAQIIDYIQTGEKKKLESFSDDNSLEVFDVYFGREKDGYLLYRFGFNKNQIVKLMENHRTVVTRLRIVFQFFENLKTSDGALKLPDGYTVPPVFIVRNLLRELPAYYLKQKSGKEVENMPPEMFCKIMAASYVKPKDLEINDNWSRKIEEFQNLYKEVISLCGLNFNQILESIVDRSSIINLEHRVTGDGLVWITEEILALKDKLSYEEIQEAIDFFIQDQSLMPKKRVPIPDEALKGNSLKARLLKTIYKNLELYKETI